MHKMVSVHIMLTQIIISQETITTTSNLSCCSMSTDCLNELPSRLGPAPHHRCGLFANIRGGPRYKEDFVKVTRNINGGAFALYYRVYNPSHLHSSDSPPLLVVHGGPSLPSDYLYPIADEMPRTRSIIFYDQLGYGKSTSDPDDDSL